MSVCSRRGLRSVHARVVDATAVGAWQMFPKDRGEVSLQNVFVRHGDARLDVLGDLPLLVGVRLCAGSASRCLVCDRAMKQTVFVTGGHGVDRRPTGRSLRPHDIRGRGFLAVSRSPRT